MAFEHFNRNCFSRVTTREVYDDIRGYKVDCQLAHGSLGFVPRAREFVERFTRHQLSASFNHCPHYEVKVGNSFGQLSRIFFWGRTWNKDTLRHIKLSPL